MKPAELDYIENFEGRRNMYKAFHGSTYLVTKRTTHSTLQSAVSVPVNLANCSHFGKLVGRSAKIHRQSPVWNLSGLHFLDVHLKIPGI